MAGHESIFDELKAKSTLAMRQVSANNLFLRPPQNVEKMLSLRDLSALYKQGRNKLTKRGKSLYDPKSP